MKDDLYIGSAPAGEDCAQLGREGYTERAWRECRALIGQLRRTFGPEPPGVRLYVRHNPHDFGTYLSVNAEFDPEDELGVTYAFRLESELPESWDDEAKAYLNLHAETKAKPHPPGPAEARRGGVP